MSVVVERGLARCPRCVAVADYAFVEEGPNRVRYEVRCKRCGAAYFEEHTPVTPDVSTAVDVAAIRAPEAAEPLAVGVQARAARFTRGLRAVGRRSAQRLRR